MNRDLIHFLRLGLMRVRHRTNEIVTAQNAGTSDTVAQATHAREIETLKILEDLMMEQVPYENIDHSAR